MNFLNWRLFKEIDIDLNLPAFIGMLIEDTPDPQRHLHSTSLFCETCGEQYVSEQEMWFLMENGHIIGNKIHTPVMPIGPKIGDPVKPIDMIATYPIKVQYTFVGQFCPHCNKAAFGSLSDWRLPSAEK